MGFGCIGGSAGWALVAIEFENDAGAFFKKVGNTCWKSGILKPEKAQEMKMHKFQASIQRKKHKRTEMPQEFLVFWETIREKQFQ